MNKVIERILTKWIDRGIMQAEDYELYFYSIFQIILTSINLISIINLGLLFHRLPETIMILVFYIPLREYAGGYHARDKWSCYLLSICLIAVMLLCLNTVQINQICSGIIAVIDMVIIGLLAPVECENKPLDAQEKRDYGRRTKELLFVYLIVYFVCYLIKASIVTNSITMALTLVCTLVIVGHTH